MEVRVEVRYRGNQEGRCVEDDGLDLMQVIKFDNNVISTQRYGCVLSILLWQKSWAGIMV